MKKLRDDVGSCVVALIGKRRGGGQGRKSFDCLVTVAPERKENTSPIDLVDYQIVGLGL